MPAGWPSAPAADPPPASLSSTSSIGFCFSTTTSGFGGQRRFLDLRRLDLGLLLHLLGRGDGGRGLLGALTDGEVELFGRRRHRDGRQLDHEGAGFFVAGFVFGPVHDERKAPAAACMETISSRGEGPNGAGARAGALEKFQVGAHGDRRVRGRGAARWELSAERQAGGGTKPRVRLAPSLRPYRRAFEADERHLEVAGGAQRIHQPHQLAVGHRLVGAQEQTLVAVAAASARRAPDRGRPTAPCRCRRRATDPPSASRTAACRAWAPAAPPTPAARRARRRSTAAPPP